MLLVTSTLEYNICLWNMVDSSFEGHSMPGRNLICTIKNSPNTFHSLSVFFLHFSKRYFIEYIFSIPITNSDQITKSQTTNYKLWSDYKRLTNIWLQSNRVSLPSLVSKQRKTNVILFSVSITFFVTWLPFRYFLVLRNAQSWAQKDTNAVVLEF